MTSTTTPQKSQYFDLITTGIGFINRARTLNVKGKPLALTFNASWGDANDKNRVTYELYVRGSEAIEIITSMLQTYNEKDDVVQARLEIGDAHPVLVTDKDGNPIKRKDGSYLIVMRGNLLKVHYLKKNNEILVQTTKKADAPADSDSSNDSSNEMPSDETTEPTEVTA